MLVVVISAAAEENSSRREEPPPPLLAAALFFDELFLMDWRMNSRDVMPAGFLNLANERLFMRVLEERSADLADCECWASEWLSEEVSEASCWLSTVFATICCWCGRPPLSTPLLLLLLLPLVVSLLFNEKKRESVFIPSNLSLLKAEKADFLIFRFRFFVFVIDAVYRSFLN
jgi:hypothetical protein